MQENILKEIRNSKVGWKELGEIASLYNGLTGKNKANFENGNAKYISYKNIFSNIEVNFQELEKVEISPNERQNEVKYGDILFTNSSETASELGFSSAITEKVEEKIYLNSFSFGLRFHEDKLLLPEFAKYLFRCDFMRKAIQKTGNGVTRINLSKEKFKKIKIPLPSLELQNKIVEILDKFSKATSELQKELKKENELRKKQYKFYREKLLSFGDEVEWKTLEELALKINSGGTPKTDIEEYYNGNIPWLRTQEVNFCDIYDTEIKITELGLKNSSAKIIPANCVIIAMYGATVGKIAINKIPMATNQACANIQVNEKIANYRYVFYFLSKEYEYIKSLGVGSQTNINAGIVKKLKIPLPSLEKQQEIVNILDKFETLTTSLTEGLPKEIELRQKQYEYYRNLLLTFEE